MNNVLDPQSVPLWTAFFAGVVSVLSLVIAKDLRVSDFRQAWIDALRGEIATLIARVNAINERRLSIAQRAAKAGMAVEAEVGAKAATKGEEGAADDYERDHADVLRLEEALATIELRMNPTEEEAMPLLKQAQAVVGMVRLDKAVCRQKLQSAEKLLLEESKTYLKTEWERVKKGEPRYRCAVWMSVLIGLIGVATLALGFAGWLGAGPNTATTGGDVAIGIEEERATETGATAGTPKGAEEEPEPGGMSEAGARADRDQAVGRHAGGRHSQR